MRLHDPLGVHPILGRTSRRHPGVIRADIPAQNFGQGGQNPGKTSILARTSTTLRDFQKLRSNKLWAEFFVPYRKTKTTQNTIHSFFRLLGLLAWEERKTITVKKFGGTPPTSGPQPFRGRVPFVPWKCPVRPADTLSNLRATCKLSGETFSIEAPQNLLRTKRIFQEHFHW